jgi:2-isopropylmalate synthase
MKKLFVLDRTLRDGEQAPGIKYSRKDKIAIAIQIEKLGIDIIEAGYPASSAEEFETCRAVSMRIKQSAVSVIARSVKEEILTAWEAVKKANHPILHISISTSPVNRRYLPGKNTSEIISMVRQAVLCGKNTGAEIDIGAEDATRTKRDFLLHFFRAAIDAGASIISVPDTSGFMTPDEYGGLICFLIKNLPEIAGGKVRLSARCRNDLGLATANTLSAILAGAGQIETSILGIGLRAGNTPVEEIIAALYCRPDIFKEIFIDLNPEMLLKTCQAVSACTGISIPSGKAIIGSGVFAHNPEIQRIYQWMEPQTFGRLESEIPLNRNTGTPVTGSVIPLIDLKKLEIEQLGTDSFSATVMISDSVNTVLPCYNGQTPLKALLGALSLVLPEGLTLNHYSCGCTGGTGGCSFQAEVSLNAGGLILTGKSGGQENRDYLHVIALAFIEAINRYKIL